MRLEIMRLENYSLQHRMLSSRKPLMTKLQLCDS